MEGKGGGIRGKRALLALSVCLLALAVLAARALAAAGQLDHGFSSDGKRTFGFPDSSSSAASDVAVDGGGRIVVAGTTESSFSPSVDGVARLKPNGSLDGSFSSDGKRAFAFPGGKSDARALAIDQQGRIVLAGTFYPDASGPSLVAVARLKPNGDLDHSFSGDGRRTFGFPGSTGNIGTDLALDPQGRIAVGAAENLPAGDRFGVARLTPSGGLDPHFSSDGRRVFGFPGGGGAFPAGIAIRGSSKVVIAGEAFNGTTAEYDFALARLTAGGNLDSSFSTDGRRMVNMSANGGQSDTALDVAIDRQGRAVAAGYAARGPNPADYDFAVLRLKANGVPDPAFSGNGKLAIDQGDYGGAAPDYGRAVTIDQAGRIVVAGYSAEGGVPGEEFAVARVRAGGGLDPSFSGDGTKTFGFSSNSAASERAEGVAIDSSGRIAIVGETDVGAGSVFAVSRLKGS